MVHFPENNNMTTAMNTNSNIQHTYNTNYLYKKYKHRYNANNMNNTKYVHTLDIIHLRWFLLGCVCVCVCVCVWMMAGLSSLVQSDWTLGLGEAAHQ